MITLSILCFACSANEFKTNECDSCNGVNQYQAGLAEAGLIPAWTSLSGNKTDNPIDPTYTNYYSIESENNEYFKYLGD